MGSEAGSQVATGRLRTDVGPTLRAAQLADRSWAVFVVTFRRPQVARATVEAILAQTVVPATVLVVDNSARASEEAALLSELGTLEDARIVVVASGENLGSAGGCAFGLQWLRERGFEWMTSVDDDDPPRTTDTIARLQALVARQASDDLGIVGAVGSRWDWRSGEQRRLADHELHGDIEVDTVGGNSLLTVRSSVIDAIGTPDPRFFFGFYDPLYCLRAKQAGFRVVVDGSLLHDYRAAAGRMDLHRSRNLVPAEPASGVWRRYYVTRNYIHRMRRTFDRPDLARREAAKAIARSVTAFGRGPRFGVRYSRLQLRGVADGYRDRLGRRVDPHAKTSRDG